MITIDDSRLHLLMCGLCVLSSVELRLRVGASIAGSC